MKKLVNRFLIVVAIAVIVVIVAMVIGIILSVRESLYGRGESGYIRYEPEVIKKYVPIDMIHLVLGKMKEQFLTVSMRIHSRKPCRVQI